MNTPLRSVITLASTAALSLAFAPIGSSNTSFASAPLGSSSTSIASPPSSQALLPAGSTASVVYFPSRDGTMLQADVLLPEGGCPVDGCTPIVAIGPYFGRGTQGDGISFTGLEWNPLSQGVSDRFNDFISYEFDFGNGDTGNVFDRGYAFVMVDSRGYGESGGCNDYGGIGEQDDAYASVEWAGTQSWSTGRVGMWGKSYDAWTQVMALAQNPPHLEAVVVQSPIIDGFGIAWTNGVHHDSGWYLTPALYQVYDQTPTSAEFMAAHPDQYLPAAATGTADTCWAEQHPFQVAGFDRDMEYWRQRDLRAGAARNDDVAVLWSHGFNDVNTKADQIFGAYTLGEGADPAKANRRAWFGHWDHKRGNEVGLIGRGGFIEEALDWFDGHLRDKPFRYEVNAQNVVEVHDQTGAWRTEATYPPADAAMTPLVMKLGTYTDSMSASATTGYWTISEPLTEELRVTGEVDLEITADFPIPGAQFVGVLYDIDPDTKQATEISRIPARLAAGGETYRFSGTPSDYVVRPGNQLAFQVKSSHPETQPYPTSQTVSVTGLTVYVPIPTYKRVSNLAGVRSTASPSTMNVSSVDLSVHHDMGLPKMLMPDVETRERLQPTVTTGAMHSPNPVPGS
jgi:predicted acyl esterase